MVSGIGIGHRRHGWELQQGTDSRILAWRLVETDLLM